VTARPQTKLAIWGLFVEFLQHLHDNGAFQARHYLEIEVVNRRLRELPTLLKKFNLSVPSRLMFSQWIIHPKVEFLLE
jgi:hypothetical protein